MQPTNARATVTARRVRPFFRLQVLGRSTFESREHWNLFARRSMEPEAEPQPDGSGARGSQEPFVSPWAPRPVWVDAIDPQIPAWVRRLPSWHFGSDEPTPGFVRRWYPRDAPPPPLEDPPPVEEPPPPPPLRDSLGPKCAAQ